MQEDEILNPKSIYVLNKKGGVLAVFNKDDEDTLIDPEVQEIQNQEARLTFQVPASSKKWTSTYNPENLYLTQHMLLSANFSDCVKTELNERGEELVTVQAYEAQKLLEREYVRVYNSTTGFEEVDELGKPIENGELYIDEFMVIVLSNGDKELLNGPKGEERIVQSTHEKGTSGYALDAILYGTGWTTGICDVEGKYDLETDQLTVYENIAKIQELWGGILVVDSINKTISHRDETKYLPYTGYQVKEEKNLQTYEYIGDNKIITALCPLGNGSLNIKSKNDGSVWLTNFSYTDTIYKSIENNEDIYDVEQLKRWGERKLQELCKPRKELSVRFPLLEQLEEFEHEEIGINHVIDIKNYNLEEEKVSQLRVIEFTRKIWSLEDANIVVGDITLDSTDIFKKNVQATNLVNNGTLDTSKIIDYYKNGRSLRETLREVDRVIIQTKSDLSKTDDEIRAAVEQIETDVDTLNNDIVSQSKTIAELLIGVGEIKSEVKTLAGLTETITSYTGKILLEDAIAGYLYGISIHGYDGSFKGTVLGDDVIIGNDLLLLDKSILMEVYSNNLASNNKDDYETIPILRYDDNQTRENYGLTTKNFIKVKPNSDMYFSVDTNEYSFFNIYLYDINKESLKSWNSLHFGDNKTWIVDKYEQKITIPEDVYYIKPVFQRKRPTDVNVEDLEELEPSDIEKIKPQIEYGSTRGETTEYSYNKYEFPLDDELRELEIVENDETKTIYDEFTILDKNAQLIRRIGVDASGNKYELTVPEIISYGTIDIPIVKGDNYVEIIGYNPTVIAQYVKQNAYTEVFATKVEVGTVIKQTDELILLTATKMVSKDKLIQEFNSQIAISPEKILIEGDKVVIKSSYFELTEDGKIIATAGTIAGWEITENALYKNKAGLLSGSGDEDIILFAGADTITVNEDGTVTPNNPDIVIKNRGVIDIYPNGVYENLNIKRLASSGTYYTHPINLSQNERVKLTKGMRFFYPPNTYNGSGYTDRNYVSTLFTNTGTFNWLANKNFWSYCGIITRDNSDTPDHYGICINNALSFRVWDTLHPNLNALLAIYRVGNNGEASYAELNVTTAYVDGKQITTNSSDERLKMNIMDAIESALGLINQILHRRFDWKKDGRHISIGYIAQELMKVDPNFVIYNEKYDTYQIDLLYVMATATKAIQEEDEKVEKLKKENEKLKKIVKMLGNELGLSKEVESILNEEDVE